MVILARKISDRYYPPLLIRRVITPFQAVGGVSTMEDQRKNCIIIDWLTFSHKLLTADEVIEVLGLTGENWVEESGSNYRYEKRKCFLHMTVHYTEKNHSGFVPGVCVEMSGQGCREFEEFSEISWSDLLGWIHEESKNPIKIAKPGSIPVDMVLGVDVLAYDHVADNDIHTVKIAQISRLDLAYDDFEGKLDINMMAAETRAFNYTTILKRHKIIEDSETADPDHVGLSVCFGSKSSNVYFRFYDKRVERERWDLDHWVRGEIQLRSAAAVGAQRSNGLCVNQFQEFYIECSGYKYLHEADQ